MKRIWVWIIIGLLIRLIAMAFVIHPDIRGHNLAAYFISQKGEIFTFYDHISRLPRTDPLVSLYGDNIFIYPPLAYLTHALFMKILTPLYPWPQFHLLLKDINLVIGQPQLPQLLILLKIPYLVADALSLWLLWKLIDSKHRLLASLLWIFNPITIHASYLMAQFDIFIALFILASLNFSKRNHTLLAAISLGLAAGYKPFPLLLLPFLGHNLSTKVKAIFVGLFTYVIIIIPYLPSAAFKQYALLANQSDKLFYAKIMVSGSQYLSLFVVGLLLLYWANYHRYASLTLWGWFMSCLLLFYSVTHYHPQWFVWVSPLLVLAASLHRQLKWPVIVLVISFLFTLLLFEPSLNFGLFGIKFNFSAWLNTRFPADQFTSIIRSVFAATSLYLIFFISKEKQ